MKNLSSKQDKISFIDKLTNRQFLNIWLVFHAGLIVFFAATVFLTKGNLKIDADLFNMLPKTFSVESIAKADEKLTESTAQSVNILVKSKDFQTAKTTAEKVYDKIKDSDNFKSIVFHQDMQSLQDVNDFVFENRWNLLDEETVELINSEGGDQEFAENALAQAYGAFTITSLENLDRDPFMLSETIIQNYLNAVQDSGFALSVKDNVLTSQADDYWYVMVRGILSTKGAALASKENAITEIYSVCSPLENDDVTFVYSGTPFHSHESSNNASREIAVISTVSILVVIGMLLFVFRSPRPILFALISILVSILTSFITTLAIFRKMHILTLVFGTSLIGSCIDYSLHYFINWKGNKNLHNGKEIRKYLFSGLTLSLASTEICYLILLFAPFNLLKQMAVFSLTGILSSYLTVMCVYPYIQNPEDFKRHISISKMMKTKDWYNKKIVGRTAMTVIFIFSIGTICFTWKNMYVRNSVSELYKIEGRLLENETEAGSVLKYSPTSWFIIRGETENQTLKICEDLSSKLKNLDAQKGTGGFASASSYIPSKEKQIASRAACKKLLELAENQLEALGYDSKAAVDLKKEFDNSEGKFITFDSSIPSYLADSLSSVWLGKIGKDFYSVIIPAMTIDNEAFESLEDGNNVYYVNKMAGMNRDFDKLTIMILRMFIIAYVVIFVVLKFFYKTKQSFKIISIPLLIILMTAAIFGIARIHLEFFSITGIILVFGLGLDYVIYMIETERRGETSEYALLEPFAILLSFITTGVSFGALALSSFRPVHLMGLAIFIGLITAYFSSFFYDRSEL